MWKQGEQMSGPLTGTNLVSRETPNMMINSPEVAGRAEGVSLDSDTPEVSKKKKVLLFSPTSIAGSISVPAATSSWAAVKYERLNC